MAYAMILKGGSSVDLDVITASASDILAGKVTVDVEGEAVTGTMTNNGAVTKALAAGGSYTIPKGYHNGSGKVTANSLASQTAGTATAADIVSGKTAWVGGSKVTGTMKPMWTGWKPIYKATAQRINDGDGNLTWSTDVVLSGFSEYNTFIFNVAYARNTSTTTPSKIYANIAVIATEYCDKTKFELDATNIHYGWEDCELYLNDPVKFGMEDLGTNDDDEPILSVYMTNLDDEESKILYGWFEVVLIAAMNL